MEVICSNIVSINRLFQSDGDYCWVRLSLEDDKGRVHQITIYPSHSQEHRNAAIQNLRDFADVL